MNALIKLLTIILGLIIIIIVMLQESKSDGASGALMGGGLNLFSKQKARGLAAILSKSTFYLVTIFLFFILLLKIA